MVGVVETLESIEAIPFRFVGSFMLSIFGE